MQMVGLVTQFDLARLVVDAPVQQHLTVVGVDRLGPVELLGDVDPDRNAHVSPLSPTVFSKPLAPDLALQSDDPQCLISGVREAARRAMQEDCALRIRHLQGFRRSLLVVDGRRIAVDYRRLWRFQALAALQCLGASA
jgi:hypothetical protein